MAGESDAVREPVERALADAREARDELAAKWAEEKGQLDRVSEITRKIDELRMEAERAERAGDLQRVAEIRYGELPALERELEERREPVGEPMVKEEVDEDDVAVGRRPLDGHPRRPAARGRDAQARPHGGAAAPAGGRPGRGDRGRVECAAPRPLRPPGPEPPDRLVRLPRPDRGRQDRAREGARRVHVRRRARPDQARHVRVHGAPRRLAARRRPAGLRRLRRGRPAHRGGAAAALLGDPARRDREGPPRRLQPAPPDPRRRAPHRRPGPHGRLPEHGPDHDLEPQKRRGDARALPARVSEQARRDRRVRAPQPRADRRDRRAPARAACGSGWPSAGSRSS